jgi:hypothetical protein
MALAGGADGSPSHATPQQMPENLLEANFGPCVDNARVAESVRNSSHFFACTSCASCQAMMAADYEPSTGELAGVVAPAVTSDIVAALTIDW